MKKILLLIASAAIALACLLYTSNRVCEVPFFIPGKDRHFKPYLQYLSGQGSSGPGE